MITIQCVAPKKAAKDPKNKNKKNPTLPPVVCSFPSGIPESLLSNSSSGGAEEQQSIAPPEFVWHYNKQQQHPHHHRLVGKDASCRYTSASLSTILPSPSSPAANKSGSNNNKKKRKGVGGATGVSELQVPPKRNHHNRTRICVGIYDKKKQTLTIHQAADNGTVYALNQTVPEYQRAAGSAANNSNAHLAGSAVAQYKALFEDFGSAKKQRVIKSQEANRVNVDTVVGGGGGGGGGMSTNNNMMSESNRLAYTERQQLAQLAAEQAAAAAGGNDDNGTSNSTILPVLQQASAAVDAATRQWRKTFLPPFHENAKFPADVYLPQELVGNNAWIYSQQVIEETCSRKNNNNKNVKEAFLELHQQQQKHPSSQQRQHQQRRADDWKPSVKRLILDKIPDNIQKLNDDDKAKVVIRRKLQCTVLLHHFLALFLMAADKKKKRNLPPLETARWTYFGRPLPVAEHFLDRFCTRTAVVPQQAQGGGRNNSRGGGGGGFAMSKANRDSCLVHLFLLYMMADYNTASTTAFGTDDIQPLAADLQIDPSEAAHLLRQAGCTVKKQQQRKVGGGGDDTGSNNSNKISAVLKTPLTFPKLKRAGGSSSGPRRR